MNYYILSFEKQGKDPELCFWRANANGYTTNVLEAGEYTLETVLASRHHDGPNAVVLPMKCLPLVTTELKAHFERSTSAPFRMVVHAIADMAAKKHLLEHVKDGAVLYMRTVDGLWHWRQLHEPVAHQIVD